MCKSIKDNRVIFPEIRCGGRFKSQCGRFILDHYGNIGLNITCFRCRAHSIHNTKTAAINWCTEHVKTCEKCQLKFFFPYTVGIEVKLLNALAQAHGGVRVEMERDRVIIKTRYSDEPHVSVEANTLYDAVSSCAIQLLEKVRKYPSYRLTCPKVIEQLEKILMA